MLPLKYFRSMIISQHNVLKVTLGMGFVTILIVEKKYIWTEGITYRKYILCIGRNYYVLVKNRGK